MIIRIIILYNNFHKYFDIKGSADKNGCCEKKVSLSLSFKCFASIQIICFYFLHNSPILHPRAFIPVLFCVYCWQCTGKIHFLIEEYIPKSKESIICCPVILYTALQAG
jgi:hypothetical protein